MRWSVVHKWYRLGAIIVQIVIFLIIFTAIYPVAARDIDVVNVGNETWKYDGDYILIEVPVTIKNDGVYDINDLSSTIEVRNSSAEFLATSQSLGDIKSGTKNTIMVKIPVNLRHLYDLESPYFYHFFHADKFNLTFSLSLKYLMDTVSVKTYYRSVIDWQPIIKEFKVGVPQEIDSENGKVIIYLPYTINTASYLWGHATFNGTVKCRAFSGTFSAVFPLGKKYSGNMKMVFNGSHLETLVTESQMMWIDGKIGIAGIEVPMNTTYMWGAPLNNLKFEVLNNGTVHYSFTNDASFALNLHIKKQYYYNNTMVYQSEESLHVEPGTSVNRYEPINVGQPVDKLIITIYDNNTGVYYQKVINL
ncbi:MAG: hypothetical protein GXO25_06720 [Euryarchaeota archaeon]|uniref:Uncharacterized protein n=1 Tax=uncultured euryarchaeote Alv-FOS4 TaxID=337893 RepID=Q3SA78_9EURY|nr:hypothetical protein [uncultured euryarchaeote Alv-FOS4]NPA75757.1 hypothetical protein [Euryarchaeota archaeon]